MTAELQTAGRFVVGTDGSERANKAVDWAAEQAQIRKIPLLVLHVIAEIPLPSRTHVLKAMARGETSWSSTRNALSNASTRCSLS